MSKQKPTNKRRDQAITLAIVGGVVTIATALISSLIGPIALEFFKRTPVPSGTSSSPSTTFTTPALTNLPTQEWSQTLAINIDTSSPLLCQGLLMPPSIRPDQDINQAAKQVMDEAKATNFDSWLVVSNPYTNDISLLLTVTNIPNDVDWIKLENNLDVSINAQSNPSKHVNVLTATGCGAGGVYRTFSGISLAFDYQNYTTTSTSAEFDFFTLQPGESEIFQVSLTCQAPGIYRVMLTLPYSLIDSGGKAQVEYDRSIICPAAFMVWAIDMFDEAFISSTSYIWNGTSYEIHP
jgi:hypothetical protein